MTTKLAITLMVLSTLAAYCYKGCLKCTPDNECLYCDATQFYKLVDGRCLVFPIDNCAQMDEKGRCVICAENNYVDPVQYTCIALPDSLIVANCAVHVGPKECSYCSNGYVLRNGVCEQNDNIITNCMYQNAKGKCLSCAKGYMRDVSRTGCIAVPTINNCATYSNIGCHECNSGYFFNPNRYLHVIFGFKNADQLRKLNTKITDAANSVPDISVFNVCESSLLLNCAQPINYETCAVCNIGYFVNYRDKCEANPLPAIPNCNNYTSSTICIDCKQGYFLENTAKCTKITPLINCLIYDRASSYTSCSKCIDDFYLNAENICMKRTALSKIDFCILLADEGESCLKCLDGYTITNDNLKCLPIVEHCDIYVKSTINSLRLECSICQPGFYFNTTYKVCSKGTVENCFVYNKTLNECNACNDNFYLVSNNCLPHKQLPSCINYSKTDADTCVECMPFTYLFTPSNNCVSVDVIDQCKVYDSKTTCQTCEDGFYLYNPSECRAILPDFNCVQLNDNGVCIKCLPNYVLDSGSCFEPQQYIANNCENTNVNGIISSSSLKCNYCRANHIPINYKESFVCQDKDYIKRKYLAPQQQFDDNCLQFVENTGTGAIECVRCNDNFVLESLTCVKSCTNSTRMTIYKQYVEVNDIDGNAIDDSLRVIKSNVCGTTIANCAIAVPNLNTIFDSPTYACAECLPGYFKSISLGGPSGIYMRPGQRQELSDNEYGTSPLTIGPGVQCLKTDATIKVIGEQSTQDYIDNCEYFQMIYPNLYGCNKCKWGMTGVSMDLIKNCSSYSNSQTCTACQVGYFLKSNKECMPVLDILNCATYDVTASSTICTQCSVAYYVNVNACTARVNSLNVIYGTASLTADTVTCDAGYILDTAMVPYSCKKLPYNCITATIAASVITCTECKRNTSYLSGGSCVDGTVVGCDQYDVAANTCITCINGRYRVNSTTCTLHTVASDTLCNVWDQTTKNLCTTCRFDAVRLQIKNKCVAVYINITNCSEYVDIYQCKTCAAGYYLDNLGRTCRAIPADSYCDTYVPIDIDGNGLYNTSDQTTNKKFIYTCTKCTNGYYRKEATVTVNLLSGGSTNTLVATCYNYLQFAREQCVETDVNGSVDFGAKYCTGCAASYFPYNFNNKYVCVERSYITLKSSSFDTNCEIHSYDVSNNLQCLRCKFGYFVNLDNAGAVTSTCVTSCNNPLTAPNDAVLPYIHSFSYTNGAISFVTGMCVSNAEAISQTNSNAAYFSTGIKLSDSSLATVISQCNSTSIPVLTYVATDYYKTYINPDGVSYKMESPFDGFEGIKSCVTQTANNIRGYVNTSNWIDDCEFYHQLDTSLYGCMKCKFGYRGRIKGYSNSGAETNYGSIEYCEAYSECDTTVVSGMYDTISAVQTNGLLNRYFSCFKCNDSGANAQVIIAAVAAATGVATPANDFLAVYGLREYKLSTATQTEAYTANLTSLSGSYSNFCAIASTLSTTLDLASTNLVITNCSAYFLNVDSTGIDADVGLICAACLPGYAPTYDGTLLFKVTACTLITNCSTPAGGKVMNHCMNCVQNYDVYTDYVDYTTCIDPTAGAISATSCFAAYDNKNCTLCRPGYELDTTVANQATCYQITVPRCSAVNFYDDFSSNYSLYNTVSETAFYLYSGYATSKPVAGCTACTSATDVLLLNKVASNTDVDPKVCVTGTDNRQTSSVSNCTRVGWDYTNSKYICRACNGGYILTLNNDCTATDATRLPNCNIAKEIGSDVCSVCTSAQYVIVGGVCLDSLAGSLPTGLVANCATYTAGTKDLAMGVCATCAATYYLNNNTCVSIPDANCSSYDASSGCLICKNNHALFKLSGSNVCIDLDSDDDTNWDYDSNCSNIVVDDANVANDDIQTKYLVCNQCKANTVLSLAVADLPIRSKCTSIVQTVDAQCSAYDVQALLSNSTIYCTACSNYTTHYLSPFTKICTARTAVTNCAAYNQNADICTSCNVNYVLNFTKTVCLSLTDDVANKPINKGYIHTCRSLPSCNTEIFYEGLDVDLTSYFSCHACKKSDEIPFLAVRTDDTGNRIESLNEYGFNGLNTDPLNKGVGGLAIQCIKPIYTNFNVALTANFVFPTNCGLGLIKTSYVPNALKSSTVSTDLDKSTIMCIACKPGYKSTNATKASDGLEVKYMASACTAITNCEFSRWFGACTQCKASYAYSYSLTTGINYGECVSYSDNPQCLSVYISGSTKICKACKKGSYLNRDGICDLINPPRCEYGRYKFNQSYLSKDMKGGVFNINDGAGCNKCLEGFAAVYANKDAFVCTESLYLVDTTLTSGTFFIQNCLNYDINPLGVLRCAVCNIGFIPTVDGRCASSSGVSNCIIAQSDSICSNCAQGYVLVNRKCEAPNILNCAEYNYDIEGFEQVCKRCDPEYYVSGNKCVMGMVKNCKVNDTDIKCNECMRGYSLILANGEKNFCFPNSPKLNCNKFDVNKFQDGILECSECINNSFVLSTSKTDFKPTFCMPFTDLDKCIQFNNNPLALTDSGFECQRCSDDYYLKEGNCAKRVIRPAECIKYQIDADKCVNCAYGYYADSTGKICNPYPEGIKGCIAYKSKSICQACDIKMYLADNKCISVISEIGNCIYYEDENLCKTCALGYLNIKGKCVLGYAQACSTFASLTECKTCPKDYGLKRDGALLNCVQKNVVNCAISEDMEPFNCLVCIGDNYPVNGVCQTVVTKIDNCIQYDSDANCTKCNNRTALSIDKKSCDNSPDTVAQVDPNCTDPILLEAPNCNSCAPGYFFKFGLCQACEVQTLAAGCYNCDSDNPRVCLMCASGFYMSAEGDCVDLNKIDTSAGRIEGPGIAKIIADGHALHE